MSKIIIRPAKPTDIDTLVAFNVAMATETESLALDEARLRSGVRGVFENTTRGFYLIAELDGQLAGSLMVTFEWSDWRNADWWWIQSVYVAPAYRRRGVYAALHEHLAAKAKSAGIRGLRLYVERTNAKARKTYEAMGMTHSHYELYEQEF